MLLRPDSGDPVEAVLLGLEGGDGAFGSSVNAKGYKVLNSCGTDILPSHTHAFEDGRARDTSRSCNKLMLYDLVLTLAQGSFKETASSTVLCCILILVC